MADTIRKFKETVDIRALALKRLRAHRFFPIAVVVMAVLSVACLHVWQRVHVITLVKEVGKLREDNREMVDLARKTYNDIAALSMASRIERYATDTLGLKPASADHLFTLMKLKDREAAQDEFATIVSSIGRVAKYLPVLTENRVNAGDVRPTIKFDSTSAVGAGR